MPVIETFAALAIAHIASDFLLQTRWIALNKSAPLPMAAHIGIVALTSWTALGFAVPGAIALLSLVHFSMDSLKTHGLGKNGFSYGFDQGVHIATVLAISLMVPDAWQHGLWSQLAPDLAHTVLFPGVVAMGAVFAMRGGLFFVDHIIAPHRAPDCPWHDLQGQAHRSACIERGAIFGGLVIAPVMTALLCLGRLALMMRSSARGRPGTQEFAGALGSILWAVMAGLGTQVTLRALTALDAAQAAYYPLQ